MNATKIPPAPAGVANQLTFTAGGVTILAGYVTADIVTTGTSSFPGQDDYPFAYSNVLVGHQYLVNLPAGSSTGLNATSIESINPCSGQNAVPASATQDTLNTGGFYRTRCADEHGASSDVVYSANSQYLSLWCLFFTCIQRSD